MKVVSRDFGDFSGAGKNALWDELEDVLEKLPLHLKASDQAGKVGELIFDPVGTNEAIKSALKAKGWGVNISIPKTHSKARNGRGLWEGRPPCRGTILELPVLPKQPTEK